MGTAAKIALGIVLGVTVLVGGCFVACGLLMALGQKAQTENAQKCLDLVSAEGTRAYTQRSFSHVEGVISNRSSSQTASYVEVGVELLDSGSVIASGWTNETNVRAGERRTFDKMIRTEGLPAWDSYRLSLRQCKLQ
jgi:hypothetical protein